MIIWKEKGKLYIHTYEYICIYVVHDDITAYCTPFMESKWYKKKVKIIYLVIIIVSVINKPYTNNNNNKSNTDYDDDDDMVWGIMVRWMHGWIEIIDIFITLFLYC